MSVPIRLLIVRSLAALVIVSLVACGGGHPRITEQPTVQHLYVGNDSSPGQILQYTLPITASSQPSLTLANSNTNSVVAVAVDSNGNLADSDLTGNLAIFNAPLTSSTTASATFKNGTSPSGQLVYNGAGDLFAGTQGNKVNLFTHPLSSSSTPSLVITDASLVTAFGATLDTNGNLFVGNFGVGGTGSTIDVFAPPYTGTPTVTPVQASTSYRKLAINSTQLFAPSVTGTTGRVDVYALPITSASAPAFAITNGINLPEALAFDSSGNLYVGNLGNATITVYSPPFSAASTPTVTLTVTGPFAIFGIAIGK